MIKSKKIASAEDQIYKTGLTIMSSNKQKELSKDTQQKPKDIKKEKSDAK